MSVQVDIQPTLAQLAGIITASVSTLEQLPASQSLHETRSEDALDARSVLLNACQQVIRKVMGPTEVLKNMALIEKHNLASLRIINHYRIFDMVPQDDDRSTPVTEIATKCHIPSEILLRILRQAMTYGLFWEPSVGMVAHTELSKEMIRLSPLLSYQLEVCLPSSLRLPDWLKAAQAGKPDSEYKSAFQIAHATTDTWWSYAEKRPDLIQKYGLYMALITNGGPHDVSHVVSGFAWGDLGEDAVVIDVGGADGFVGIALAQAYANLTVFVQDSINLKEGADAKIPPALKSRVFFQPHSFFEPQTRLAGMADVLLLRHILHDWDDNDCLVILRHLAAVLQPGASIIVAEQVLGQPGTYDWQTERVMRALDMQMMTQFGSKERTFDDWEKLFQAADPTLQVVGMVQPAGSADTLMELKKVV
ncbi:S-adenosyl-L-methionine-dependent methyltransferase [Aspergillus recurvatus]